MDYKVEIEIDLQEVFYNLRGVEQERFIKENLDYADIDDIIEHLESLGYKVEKK